MTAFLERLAGRTRKIRSVLPASFRYGPRYRGQLEFLARSQWARPREHAAYQLRQLQGILRHAFAHVPYYRDLARQLGVRAEDFHRLEDLRQLPLLTREMVQERQAELTSEKVPEYARQRRYTGGTGGRPLGFVVEAGRTDPVERAFVQRCWSWFGLRFEDPGVLVRGYALAPEVLHRGEFWQRWYPERRWFGFSSYHMTPENLPAYARRIQEIDPVMISCVASDLDPLARYWLDHGLPPLPRLAAIHQSGMVMFPDQRDRFEKAFGARTFCTYGQSECAVLASECECSARYHVFPEYGVTEILRQDGTPAAPGEVGELVGTPFHNRALPFIRYRTGDLAAWSPRPCHCGRAFPILDRVEGRGQYVVVARDGLVVTLNSILYGSHLPELKAIRRIQVRQDAAGELAMDVVPADDFTSDVRASFLAALDRVVDGKIRFTLNLVQDIPTPPGQKFKVLVQNLDVSWWSGYRSQRVRSQPVRA